MIAELWQAFVRKKNSVNLTPLTSSAPIGQGFGNIQAAHFCKGVPLRAFLMSPSLIGMGSIFL